jgi:hypothetical protein
MMALRSLPSVLWWVLMALGPRGERYSKCTPHPFNILTIVSPWPVMSYSHNLHPCTPGGLTPARVETPPPACLPDTHDTCQPRPPTERLSIFSDLDVKAHMHDQTRSYIITKGLKPSVHKKLHKIPWIFHGRHFSKRYECFIMFLKKCKCHPWRKEKYHALPHRFDVQPKVCRSVQPYRRPTHLPHLPKARWHLLHAVRL